MKPSAAEDLTDIFANDFDNKSEQQVSQEQDKSSSASASSVSAAAAGGSEDFCRYKKINLSKIVSSNLFNILVYLI